MLPGRLYEKATEEVVIRCIFRWFRNTIVESYRMGVPQNIVQVDRVHVDRVHVHQIRGLMASLSVASPQTDQGNKAHRVLGK